MILSAQLEMSRLYFEMHTYQCSPPSVTIYITCVIRFKQVCCTGILLHWFSICQICKQNSSLFHSWHWFHQRVLEELGSSSSHDGLFDFVTSCTDCCSTRIRGRPCLLKMSSSFLFPTTRVYMFTPSGADTELLHYTIVKNRTEKFNGRD